MRFAFDDDQAGLRDLARDVLVRECPPEVLQEAWRDPSDSVIGGRVWHSLAELGAMGILVPESVGGLGLDETYLVGVLEQTGYAALPGPFVETAAVAAPALAALPDTAPLVEGILAGTDQVTVDPGDGLVPYAAQSSAVLSGAWAGSGPLELLTGGTAHAEPVVDRARPVARLCAPERRPIGGSPRAADLAWQRGVLGTSAQLVGLARRMLDLAVDYVGQREQFGVPVGSFQAIKHVLAERFREIEFAAPAVYRAAWSIAHADPDTGEHVAMAKVLASDAARDMAQAAVQCHAAMGYTVEYDLHVYAKRAWALARAWGSAQWHRCALAERFGLSDTNSG